VCADTGCLVVCISPARASEGSAVGTEYAMTESLPKPFSRTLYLGQLHLEERSVFAVPVGPLRSLWIARSEGWACQRSGSGDPDRADGLHAIALHPTPEFLASRTFWVILIAPAHPKVPSGETVHPAFQQEVMSLFDKDIRLDVYAFLSTDALPIVDSVLATD